MNSNRSVEAAKLMAEARDAFKRGRQDLAESLLKRVLALTPQNPEAHFALGTAAVATGDLPSAITRMREALRCEPRFQIAAVWLALIYMQSKDFAQAEIFAQRVLKSDPSNIQCLKVLGQCSVEHNDFPSALQFFEEAVKLQPNDAQAQFARATVLRRLHRLTEALDAFQLTARITDDVNAEIELAELQTHLGSLEDSAASCTRALEKQPGNFRANLLLARILSDEGRFDEAERYWTEAQLNEPAVGQALIEKSMHYSRVGRFREAEADALQVIELDPKRGKPYYVLFASRKVTAEDRPHIDRIERALSDPSVSNPDRADLLYALGKAYDNLGEYENAIQAFDQANVVQHELLLGNKPFDRDLFRSTVDAQIAMLTKEVLSPTGGSEFELPLFVLGMPRSGTTLVDQILSCHPQVGSVGEQAFWLDYEKVVIDYNAKQFHTPSAHQLKKTYKNLLTSLSPGFPLVVDKNPANVVVAGLLHLLFPASRIICTRRNAVDTALSLWMTQMQTEAPFVCDRSNIVFAFKQCYRLMEHWRYAMPASRYLEVRYESLIEEPEHTTRAMVEFCGLEWSDECLHPERNKGAIRTPSFWQARQPVYRTSVDRWKRYEKWLGPFEELIGL